MVSKFEKFDVSSLSFEEVQVSLRDSVLLPRVGSGECPLFQLPYLVTLGVPKQGKFFPTDKDRLFVQLVLEGDVLGNFRALDEFLGSEAFKLKLFGAQGASYEYSPIVKQGPRGEHMKIKLQTNRENGKITTAICTTDGDLDDVETLQGFEKRVPYNSNIRTIIKLVKVWTINKKYGATFKLVRAGVLTLFPVLEPSVVFMD